MVSTVVVEHVRTVAFVLQALEFSKIHQEFYLILTFWYLVLCLEEMSIIFYEPF